MLIAPGATSNVELSHVPIFHFPLSIAPLSIVLRCHLKVETQWAIERFKPGSDRRPPTPQVQVRQLINRRRGGGDVTAAGTRSTLSYPSPGANLCPVSDFTFSIFRFLLPTPIFHFCNSSWLARIEIQPKVERRTKKSEVRNGIFQWRIGDN